MIICILHKRLRKCKNIKRTLLVTENIFFRYILNNNDMEQIYQDNKCSGKYCKESLYLIFKYHQNNISNFVEFFLGANISC